MLRITLLNLFLFCIVCFGIPDQVIYEIKRGDTIYSISRSYNVPVETILEANRSIDPKRLFVGDSIIIPDTVVVEKGDTLYSIARSYDISLPELYVINKLDTSYVLKAGDVLYVPGEKKSIDDAETASEGENWEIEEHLELTKALKIEGKQPEWPLAGSIQKMEGKLKGVKIYGEEDETVKAISSGKVVWVGPYRGFGHVVFVESKTGYIYMYGGNKSVSVNVGDKIGLGDVLGILGVDPHENKPQLFFTVYKDGKPINPELAPRS